MQIKILSGIYATVNGDFGTAYPRNNIPVPKQNGISNGQFRPSDGIVELATGPGIGRGGINWNGTAYYVMGEMLVRVSASGDIAEIGNVGAGGFVSMAYSFDYLAISSDERLFLYDGTALEEVTDVDLGKCLNVIWIDGYFMSTDGDALVVGELPDPFDVNILRYGSSEINPDPIKGTAKLSNEVYAVNRYSIEVFDNVGGTGFPFRRIEGAAIERGAVGTQAFVPFEKAIAFIGGALNEELGVWIAASGQESKISTREIDDIIGEYSEAQLSTAVLETRLGRNHRNLYIHLPDQTLVYDEAATRALSMPIWYTLDSGLMEKSIYRARHFVYCYDKWICADPLAPRLGVMSEDISSHYGETIRWDIWTPITFNENKGFVIHELELRCITGRVEVGKKPTVSNNYSDDGVTYSQDKTKRVGTTGKRNKRILWLEQGLCEGTRVQHFHGTSDGHISVARLDAVISGCAY